MRALSRLILVCWFCAQSHSGIAGVENGRDKETCHGRHGVMRELELVMVWPTTLAASCSIQGLLAAQSCLARVICYVGIMDKALPAPRIHQQCSFFPAAYLVHQLQVRSLMSSRSFEG